MKRGYDIESYADSGVLSIPLSFLKSGRFHWNDAGLYLRGIDGYYWSLRSSSTAHSNGIGFGGMYLNPQNDYAHGIGLAVRCVASSIGNSSLTLGEIASRLRTYGSNPSSLALAETKISQQVASFCFTGTLDRIRTYDTLFRRQVL